MLQSLFGAVGLTAIVWALSEARGRVSWRVVAAGLAAQFALAALMLKVPAVKIVFLGLNHAVEGLQTATRAGTGFVFGYLGGAPVPFAEQAPGGTFILAFQALPLVMVISALSALLYHWNVLPLVVRGFAALLTRTMGIGGAVGVSSAATAFIGMIEAPLLIRPYLAKVSRGELFVIMTGGMATIAGTVMVLYASFLQGVIPDPMGHLLTASLISVPAAIMVARIMIPDDARTDAPARGPEHVYASSMDAVARGTIDGLSLLLNIVAMLVVLVALVHLANMLLGALPDVAGTPLTLQRMLSWIMIPVVWLMGIPAAETATAGTLMGTKTVLNELLAYLDLARLPPEALSERSRIIMTYGMCGFANLGSLGILVAGLGAMAPERRKEIVALGPKSVVSGTLASCLTGAVVGVLV